MVYKFSVLFLDEIVADVMIDIGKNFCTIHRHVSGPKQPFMAEIDSVDYVYKFLHSRCYDDARPDLSEILKIHGMTSNNPYEWCRKTHGVKYQDFWWVRYPGETLTWSDVNPRK